MGSRQENAKVFKALCDPKRLAILEQLRSGEKCACVLQEPMDLTQSGLSYHMKILCDSGFVTSRQEGKWTHYRLSGAGRDNAVKLLLALTTPDTDGKCPKCNALEEAVRAALAELGMDTDIDHVTDFAQIAAYGVMTTPTLVVDGKVVPRGKTHHLYHPGFRFL